VLGLGDRHAVAGTMMTERGAVEEHAGFLGVCCGRCPLLRCRAGGVRLHFANAPENDVNAERFIARHIRIDKRSPDVPSSEPVMIWILFMSTKPMAASARPA